MARSFRSRSASSFEDNYALQMYNSGALGASGDSSQPLQVPATAVAFLDRAKQSLVSIQSQAEAIGPPGWFAIGSSYGEKWQPILDQLAALLDDAKNNLDAGSPEMAQFNQGAIQLNNAVFKIRNESGTQQLYEVVIATLKGNPIALMRYVERQASAAGDLVTVDIPKAAIDTCSPLAMVTGGLSPAQWFSCAPTWTKVAIFGLAALVGWKIFSAAKSIVKRNPRRLRRTKVEHRRYAARLVR